MTKPLPLLALMVALLSVVALPQEKAASKRGFEELTAHWKSLAEDKAVDRVNCIRQIAALQTNQSVRFLEEELGKQKNVRIRRALIYGLVRTPKHETTRRIFNEVMNEGGSLTDKRTALPVLKQVSADWREKAESFVKKTKDHALFSTSVSLLAGAKDDAAFEFLKSKYAAEDDLNRKRVIAAAVLRNYSDKRSFNAYIKPNVKAKSPVVLRRAALQALSKERDERLFAILKRLRDDVSDDFSLANWARLVAAFDTVKAIIFCVSLVDEKKKLPRLESALLRHLPEMKSEESSAWFRSRGFASKLEVIRRASIKQMGAHPQEGDSKLLIKASKDRSAPIVSAAIEALGRHRDPKAGKRLDRLIGHKDSLLAAEALQARWGQLSGNAEAVETCREIAKSSRSWRMRMTAMNLLKEKHASLVRQVLYLNAEHEEALVRAAAFDALTYVREREVVEFLLALLKKDKSRSRFDLADALADLTGFSWGVKFERWDRWWSKVRDEYPIPEKPKEKSARRDEEYGGYYGISIKSERLVFVVDISGSMGAKVKTTTRLAEAKRNLIAAVQSFNSDTRFSLIAFDNVLDLWRDPIVRATKANKQEAVAWAQKLAPRGGTNIHDALMAALDLEKVDTIFFLSDGAPSAGPVTDPDEILRAVREENRTKRIRIHTIGVQLQGQMKDFLETLAAENFGESRVIN